VSVRFIAGLGLSLALILSVATNSQAQDQIEDLRDEREDNRRDAAQVAAELDELSAEDAELAEALAAIDAHIELQEGKVTASLEAIAAAEEEAAEARRRAANIGDEIDGVRERLRRSAVEAFVGPGDRGLAELDAGDLLAAAVRESLREQVIGNEYDLVDELRTKEAEQAEAERVAEDLVAAVEAERVDLEARLAELDEARRDAEALRAQVEIRVAEWQAVGAEIETADRQITLEIQRLEAEAQRKAAEEEARRRAEEEAARRIAEEAAAEDAATGEAEDEPAAAEESDQASDSDTPVLAGEFLLTHRPVSGVVTSPYGDRVHPIFGTVRAHKGIDFDGDRGDAIVAGADGVVLAAGWRNGYGNTVVLSHGNGFTTLYAHMTEVAVIPGESVVGGEQIGSVGSTGWSTGPHLHLELRVAGIAVDPAPYLP
jgi:murein DD-endopeptidase MepM/ murein hydrolase activator NlpD